MNLNSMIESKTINKLCLIGTVSIFSITFVLLILFFVLFPDNIMHSDMAAEVLLSKLMADNGEFIFCKDWFYSTEIRVVYTQLVMTPLFHIISDFGVVKLISIIILNSLLAVAFYNCAKDFYSSKATLFLSMALLFAPQSNEYLDMMFIGNFYTCQAICMFVVLKHFFYDKNTKIKPWWRYIFLVLFSIILGLSGLRYIAALYLPLLGAVILFGILDRKNERNIPLASKFILSILLLFGSGIGFLINKFILSKLYSFDQTTSAVGFVPLETIPERFLKSITMMVDFLGYRKEISFTTRLGMVNVIKIVFLIFMLYVVVSLFIHRHKLKAHQRLLVYYFVGLFLLNWFMIIFTDVKLQYRYWIPIYVVIVLLIGLYFEAINIKFVSVKPIMALFCVGVVLSCLYGELWQDTKYNDCEKRYGYMDFLESEDYEFGYATFWNAEVTEYLSNGNAHVAGINGDPVTGQSIPYEWLCDKNYYREGYHKGKTFLLLAVTEEPALTNGDITFMQDSKKVYQDAYYVVYEGEGMYLFTENK